MGEREIESAAPRRRGKLCSLLRATGRPHQVLLILAFLVPGLLAGWFAHHERSQSLKQVQRFGQRSITALTEHAAKVLETQALILHQIATMTYGRSWDELEADGDLAATLSILASRLEQVDAIGLADASGELRMRSSWRHAGAVSIADQDYFLAHATGSTKGVYISEAHASPVAGVRQFSMSVARTGPDGEFDGIIFVAVSLDYFTNFWKQFAPTEAYLIPLVREDGALLIRHPALDHPRRLSPDGPFMTHIRRAPQGRYTAVSLIDGIERINTYSRIKDFPLYIGFSIETRAIRDNWLRQVVLPAALMAVLSTAALVALAFAVILATRRQHVAGRRWRELAENLKDEAARRRLAEVEARVERDRLRMTIASLPHFIWTATADGQVDYTNPQMRAYAGLSQERMSGSAWLELLHPNDQEGTRAAWRIAVTNRKSYDRELRIRRHDGVYHWFKVRGVAQVNEQGEVVKWFGSCTDIDELRRTEEELKFHQSHLETLVHERTRALEQEVAERERAQLRLGARERGFRTLADSVPDVIARFDRQLRFMFVNRAIGEATGLDRDALIGKTSAELGMPPEQRVLLECTLRAAFNTGARQEIGFDLASPDGLRHFMSMIVPERSEDGIIDSIVCVARDVTAYQRTRRALEAAKEEAERANAAKSRFLAAASHDLRQPLSALSIYVDMLRPRVPADNRALVENVRDCVASLSQLLTDLLDMSKLDAGVVAPVVSDFPVDDVLNTLWSVHAPEARLKDLRFHCAGSGLIARTDPVLFQRMLGNLISNAIRYTDSGGVLVGCRRRAGKRWVEVWDTGVGFPEDKKSEIFEEFKQLGDTARTRGSGLGLAIVAKTAELLGLEIRVNSRVGRGSMFALELPLGTEAPSRPAPQIEHRLLHIALVEDNATVRQALNFALSDLGHTVTAAESGTVLRERLAGRRPDIVISDFRLMSGETGFDVIDSIRAAHGSDVAALVITGETDPRLMRSMAARGILVQHKPVDLEALQACLGALCT